MNPTAWFRYRTVSDRISTVARWYWPEATLVEVNSGSGWREEPLFLDVTDDPGWEDISEEDAEAWLAEGGAEEDLSADTTEMAVESPAKLVEKWKNGTGLSPAEAQAVMDAAMAAGVIDFTDTPEDAVDKLLGITPEQISGTRQFHLQGQHDQGDHAGGRARRKPLSDSDNMLLGYRPGQDAKGVKRLTNWLREEFFPTGEFDIGDFGTALLGLPASAIFAAFEGGTHGTYVPQQRQDF